VAVFTTELHYIVWGAIGDRLLRTITSYVYGV
jgi:hypothetical protein